MSEKDMVRNGSHLEPDSGTGGGIVGNTEVVWEDKIRTLRDIITTGKYPCVVKIKRGDVNKYQHRGGDDTCSGEDVVHVLELRRHKMVVAMKQQWDRRSGEYQQTGKQAEINATQKGWFEVLPDNGQPVEYFDTINAIVAIRPKQFLVRTSIVGYQLSVENDASCWMPWEIRPGEVLTTGIVHMDQKKTKKKTLFKRIFSSGKGAGKKEQELRYLQCFDSENREIMIPLIMTGVFSPVGDHTNPNYDAVYTLHDIISAFNLPIKAQLIHSDAHGYQGVPSGVLLLERLKDSETALVAKHPFIEGESEQFEIPLSDEFHVLKEKKKKTVKKPPLVSENDNNIENTKLLSSDSQVDLPIRVKDTKRSKGSAILEKLSVRSKGKKERASLKALQEAGVFSSRLSKSDISTYEQLSVESESNTESNGNNDIPKRDSNSDQIDSSSELPQSKRTLDLENGYSISSKQNRIQDRDLPPIPNKTKSPIRHKQTDKESVYEELPLAPRPPNGQPGLYLENSSSGTDNTDITDDGYMTPARFRELNEQNTGVGEFDVVVKRKPPTAPRDSLRYTRARKVKSEFTPGLPTYETETDENIDQLFDFTYTEGSNAEPESAYERKRQSGYGQVHVVRGQSQNDVQQLPKHKLYITDAERRKFHDDSALESKSLSGFAKLKSRSQKNLNIESNATIRSHNVRKMRTAMEVFNFNDSLRDLRQPFQNGGDSNLEATYGRVLDNERINSYVYGEQNPYGRIGGPHYVESEPGFRKYYRSSSVAALSDSFPKHGDDSAISCGEYGFHGESDYSYSEYSEWHDDGWIPPDDISSLSVLEISKSLRYIGMKDRVVIRFSREQIDGNMLCSLDKKLLKEGFPELNALDIKKIVDFIGGWRPKK